MQNQAHILEERIQALLTNKKKQNKTKEKKGINQVVINE
jgi:hypothetical protein